MRTPGCHDEANWDRLHTIPESMVSVGVYCEPALLVPSRKVDKDGRGASTRFPFGHKSS